MAMDVRILFATVISALIVVSSGQITPVPLFGFLGDDVLVPCRHGMPEDYIWAVYWHRLHYTNGTLDSEEFILEYDIENDDELSISHDWEPRLNFTWPSGNITLYGVEHEDDGRYQCQARIDTQWGIEAHTDIQVYEQPQSFSIFWDDEETTGCGDIIPRVRTTTDLSCRSVSKPGSVLEWTFYKDGVQIGDNETVWWNTTCEANEPYPVECDLPYTIEHDYNNTDDILHKCSMTYTYLGYIETREACVMYDPLNVADSASFLSISVCFLLLQSTLVWQL